MVLSDEEHEFWLKFFEDDPKLQLAYRTHVTLSWDNYIDWDFALGNYYYKYRILYFLFGSATPHLSRGEQYRKMLQYTQDRVGFIQNKDRLRELEHLAASVVADRRPDFFMPFLDHGHQEVLELWEKILLNIQQNRCTHIAVSVSRTLLKFMFIIGVSLGLSIAAEKYFYPSTQIAKIQLIVLPFAIKIYRNDIVGPKNISLPQIEIDWPDGTAYNQFYEEMKYEMWNYPITSACVIYLAFCYLKMHFTTYLYEESSLINPRSIIIFPYSAYFLYKSIF